MHMVFYDLICARVFSPNALLSWPYLQSRVKDVLAWGPAAVSLPFPIWPPLPESAFTLPSGFFYNFWPGIKSQPSSRAASLGAPMAVAMQDLEHMCFQPIT